MRWFIALLVVANVILFFWVQQQSRPPPGSMALPPPDIGRLRLMSELNQDQMAGGAGDAIIPPVEPSPIPVELLTRLEAASEEPLDVELSRLLDAIQHGFGRRSAVLEPSCEPFPPVGTRTWTS